MMLWFFFSLHRRRIYQVIIEFLHPCNKNTKWNNSMKRPPAAAKEIKSWGSVAWGAGNSGRPMGGDTASAGRWKRTGLLPWKARHPGPPCGGRSAAFVAAAGAHPWSIMQCKTPAPQVAGRTERDGARGSCKLMEEESGWISELNCMYVCGASQTKMFLFYIKPFRAKV